MSSSDEAAATQEPADTFEDLEECFRPVAKKHGRAIFATVMNLGMGQQAAGVLGVLAEKHQSRHGTKAVVQLTSALSQIASAFAAEKGWTAELLAQVDRDIQDAFRARDRAPIIVLH